jgi:HAD superfamily phosphoserine phosphatase-like hydrolase
VFDVDGTLIRDTVFIWQTLHQAFQSDPEICRRAAEDYRNGRITYAQWATLDVALWQEKGATSSDIEHALRGIRPMDGARQTLLTLKHAGYRLGIVSGSLDMALELTFPDWRELFDEVLVNRLRFDGGGQLIGVTPTEYDIERKGDGLRELGRRLGVEPERIAFIGDHFNDVSAAEAAGFAIAFDCKSEQLARVADVVVSGPDLRRILPYLLSDATGAMLR